MAQGTLPQGFLFSARVDNSQGFVTLIMAGTNAANVRSLAIAEITFNLVGSAGQSTPITLVDGLASDASARPITVAAVNGSIRLITLTAVSPPGPAPTAPGATPTPSVGQLPTPTYTPAPTPTPTPRVAATATRAATPPPAAVVASPAPTSTPSPISPAAQTTAPQPIATSSPTQAPSPSATRTATPTSVPVAAPAVTQPTPQPGQAGSGCSLPPAGTGYSLAGAGDVSLLMLGLVGLYVLRRKRPLQ